MKIGRGQYKHQRLCAMCVEFVRERMPDIFVDLEVKAEAMAHRIYGVKKLGRPKKREHA